MALVVVALGPVVVALLALLAVLGVAVLLGGVVVSLVAVTVGVVVVLREGVREAKGEVILVPFRVTGESDAGRIYD